VSISAVIVAWAGIVRAATMIERWAVGALACPTEAR
jgi:hypothetical protein